MRYHFREFHLTFAARKIKYPWVFPNRSDLTSTTQLWAALRESWRHNTELTAKPRPWLLNADMVQVMAVLHQQVELELRGSHIGLTYLTSARTKVTPTDVVGCHIFQPPSRLLLFDPHGFPSIIINTDTSLVQTDFALDEFVSAQELITTARERFEIVIAELTGPCKPRIIEQGLP